VGRGVSNGIKILTAAWNFDSAWYLEKYAEVLEAGTEPLSHYINFGKREGRNKNKSYEGIGRALIRMVKTLKKDHLKTAPRIILKQVGGAIWEVALKQTSKPMEGFAVFSARNRHEEYRLSERFQNRKDIKILLKVPKGIQIISISLEDKYRERKTVVRKFTKVSDLKRARLEKIVSQKYDGFVDLSAKPARTTIWRQLETKFRNKRAKMLPFLWKQQKTVVNKTKNQLE
jgi:hypothetical protein